MVPPLVSGSVLGPIPWKSVTPIDYNVGVIAAAPVPRPLRWLRYVAGGAGVVGVGMIAVHWLGWAGGFNAWDSPSAVTFIYLATGFAACVAAYYGFYLVVLPLLWVGRVLFGKCAAAFGFIWSLPNASASQLKVLAARLAPWAVGLVIATSTLAATGGAGATWFWVMVLVRMAMAAFQTMIFGALAAFAVNGVIKAGLGVLRMVGLTSACLGERTRERVQVAVVAMVGVVAYAGLGSDFPGLEEARLPLADPVWGSLAVLAAVAVAGLAVSVPIRRYRDRHLPGRHRAFRPAVDAPVEPKEEFWSATPVNGWRTWRWNGHTLHGSMQPWPAESRTATCDSCSEVPGWSHTCGIYAVTEREEAPLFGVPADMVVGRVELSGLVIEHEKGYRAEHARIVELFVTSTRVAGALRIRYPLVEVHTDDERSVP